MIGNFLWKTGVPGDVAESAGRWERGEFGRTVLGDVRRTERLLQMAEKAATCPSGKVAVVFNRAADRLVDQIY